VRLVDTIFALSDREIASRLLAEQCGINLPFLETQDAMGLERYRFAALKLSNGNLDELRRAIELAKTDWRDLLVAADFAHDVHGHKHWLKETLHE
jgi:hypothetical protein